MVQVRIPSIRTLDEKLKRFDWAMALAAYWAVTGLYVDAAWHIRHDVDTFFTWAHALLYSGLLILLILLAVRYRAIARSREPILQAPYGLSMIGAAVFFLGGVADTINHLFFGFESGFDSLLSPTHQVIGVGMLLVVSGPIRAALGEKRRAQSLFEQLPLVVAAAAILELLHWGTQVFFRVDAARSLGVVVPHELNANAITLSTFHFFEQGGSLIAVLLQSLLMMGLSLYLVRNFPLRAGAFTVFFLLGNGLIAFTHALNLLDAGAVITASLAAGIIADLFLLRGPALTLSRLRYETFAFVVPAVYTAALIVFVIVAMGGTWWDPIFTAGSIFYSGLFSLLLSIVAFDAASERAQT